MEFSRDGPTSFLHVEPLLTPASGEYRQLEKGLRMVRVSTAGDLCFVGPSVSLMHYDPTFEKVVLCELRIPSVDLPRGGAVTCKTHVHTKPIWLAYHCTMFAGAETVAETSKHWDSENENRNMHRLMTCRCFPMLCVSSRPSEQAPGWRDNWYLQCFNNTSCPMRCTADRVRCW